MGWLEGEVNRALGRDRRRSQNLTFLVVICSLFLIAVVLVVGAAIFLSEEQDVAVIRIEGVMMTGDFNSDGYVGSETVGRQIRNAADNPLINAIVLRVNSGGGTPAAAQEIIGDIEYARGIKPVVTSMGDLGASAAYQISAHTDLIYANRDTLTGSIGSLWVFYNMSKYLEDEGIAVEVIKSGSKKDMTSDYRGLTDEERVLAQQIVDESFSDFISDVVEQRNVDPALLADARIFRGEEALEIGLIDRIGNLYDAVASARELAAQE